MARRNAYLKKVLAEAEHFVAITSLVLDIDPPELVVDEDGLLDDTSKAGVIQGEADTPILVNQTTMDGITEERKKMEFFLILAHELRHIWQNKNRNGKFYQKTYLKEDGPKYENQVEEVDANAFAYLMFNDYFKKIPRKGTWCIYSFDAVMDRVEEIMDEFNARLHLLFGEGE